MEFVIGWSLFGIGLCVIFYIISCIHRRYVERHKTYYDPRRLAEQRRLKQARNKEFRELVEYNLAHLPSTELPLLDPDWSAVDRFIKITGFQFLDKGDNYQYGGGVNYYDNHYILKSEFNYDSLQLIELLDKDVDWFGKNPTGITLSEENEVLENFLRKKYSGLSENSIKYICLIYFNYN